MTNIDDYGDDDDDDDDDDHGDDKWRSIKMHAGIQIRASAVITASNTSHM